MKAWHFLKENRRCGYGRLGVVEVGKTLSIKGKIALCNRGFHASTRLIDALDHAPGPVLCRVEMGGTIIKGDDKVVAAERTALWMADISDLLHRFACDEAERALRDQKVTDRRSWAAIETKRKWLKGQATDAELDAARAAARVAARDAARDAQNRRLTARVNRLMKRGAK